MPRHEPYRRRQIRIPVFMNDGLDRLARERGVTVSALIRIAIARTFFLPGDGSSTTNLQQQQSHPEGHA